MNKYHLYILFIIVLFSCKDTTTIATSSASLTPKVPEKVYKFGFDVDSFDIASSTIKLDEFLGSILGDNGISAQNIYKLEKKADSIYSVRKIKGGKNYHLVSRDSILAAFVYEESPMKYVVYDFRDSVDVKVVDVPYDTHLEKVSGTIESSLWNAMVSQGHSGEIIDLMEDALASQVSFYHAKKGDQFKAIYEKRTIKGEMVGLGKMIGAYYKNAYGDYYSVYFDSEKYAGFYDLEGRASKKSFLKSPIRAGRISSRYNLRRLHPIKRRRIPHKGTDYAAPYGTKIHAVANGVVTKRGRTRGNGNYIKIKHDGTYSSQYLHMQRFVKSVRVGTPVVQGQTIGYVGSTGLATGPHVCFRFWKNGRQIDHLKENFPPADPMPDDQLPEYFKHRDQIVEQLNNISLVQPLEFKAIDTTQLSKTDTIQNPM